MGMTPARPRIAVLSKKSLSSHPYPSWLAGCEVSLFAQDDAPTRAFLSRNGDGQRGDGQRGDGQHGDGQRGDGQRGDGQRGDGQHGDGQHGDGQPGGGFASVRLFSDWKANGCVDLAVVAAHRTRPFDRVVALSECDQVRAGQLRDRLGIAGQSAASALAFRDKVVMKRYAAAAGLATPRFAPVDNLWQAVDFAAEFATEEPAGIVIKPVDGAGAQGVVRARDRADIRALLAGQRPGRDEPARLIAEAYVDAPVLAVDGMMAAGELLFGLVSTYRNSCHDSVVRLRPMGYLQSGGADPTGRRALDYTRALLAALPCPAEPTSLHCELFDDPVRGMMLCEIACRTGGGRITDMTIRALGVDLDQCACLGQAGLSQPAPRPDPAGNVYGSLAIPGPGRVLRGAPERCELPGVLDYRLHHPVGHFVPRAAKVSHAIADVLLSAADPAQLIRTHDDAVRWLTGALRWE